ncbi:uncharacterized protein LOC101855934 [Aplysia californica]|uniref:Uncharacterized protein LOC101855934 n=1 Tax=Aplysia californica TaxID=6500 RepID=A0ABM0ZW97_APLCA|nr:uncharacterized protein LOC101855934 [Aplysia californica]
MATSKSHGPSEAHFHRDSANFVPLRLGPVSRSKTQADSLKLPSMYSGNGRRQNGTTAGGASSYPRIIVRDPMGRTLDTFTTLQEAIYRASWTRKKMKEWPRTPLEWRLPKAPPPSRPDYTRVGLPARSLTTLAVDHSPSSTSRSRDVSPISGHVKQLDLVADVLVPQDTLEIPVDDVAFVAESLNHLPDLPSFSFLRHSLLAGRSTYVQIVASILLHQKQLRAKDIRQAEWQFPGFCGGCKRAGFCYGCKKNPKPHVHEDVPAMTGGGFRFWKRDRPRDPQNWKHPGNWNLPTSEKELQGIIEQFGGLAAYEQAVIAARREMATRSYGISEGQDSGTGSEGHSSRLQRLRNLGTYPPFLTIISTDGFLGEQALDDYEDEEPDDEEQQKGEAGDGADVGVSRRSSRRSRVEEEAELAERSRRVGVASYQTETASEGSRERTSRQMSQDSGGLTMSELTSDQTTVRIDTGYDDYMSEDDVTNSGRPEHRTSVASRPSRDSEDRGRGRKVSRISNASSHPRSQSDAGVSKRSPARARTSSRFPVIDTAKEEEEAELARLRKERAKQSVPFGKKRKDVLYKGNLD